MSTLASTSDPAQAGRPRPWLTAAMLAALAAAAFALCCVRLAPIPGVEWYLGPVAYLFILRRWGLIPGLVAAVICMAPSLVWWGHPVSIIVAVGHVAFVHWRGARRLLVPSTLMYACAAYLVIGAPFLHAFYNAAPAAIVLVLVRKIINDVACAAVVDLLIMGWTFFEGGRFARARRPISIATFVRSWAHAGLLVIVISGFMGSIASFQRTFDYFGFRQLDTVRTALRQVPPPPPNALTVIDAAAEPGPLRVAVAGEQATLDVETARRLGCRTLNTGLALKSFDQLVDRCSVHVVDSPLGRPLRVMTADRGPAELAYRATVETVLPDLVLSVLLTIALATAQWLLERDAGNWRTLLQGFGHRRIEDLPDSRFIEFAEPLKAFIAANNAYVADQADANMRRETFQALKRSLALRVLQDIRYDADEGLLRFMEYSADGVPEPMQLQVHPADQDSLERALLTELSAEFRVAGEPGQWWMIYAQDRDADGVYERGLSFRLHQPRMAISYLQQHARLQDLGVSTAATAHELQQPLMVVALAAEQGLAQSEQALPAPIPDRTLYERILGQARRAQRIVDRISRRARLGDEEGHVDPALVITDVLADLEPQLRRANAGAQVVNRCDPDLRLVVSPTSLEQVLINALRNAADSISAHDCGEPGQVLITLGVDEGGHFQVTIEDNGKGLPPGSAEAVFEPFYTTKSQGVGTGLGLYISRVIVEEWGGQLDLSPRAPSGAVFTLTIPSARVSA